MEDQLVQTIINQGKMIQSLLFAVIMLTIIMIISFAASAYWLYRCKIALVANTQIVRMFCQILDEYLPEEHKFNIDKKESK